MNEAPVLDRQMKAVLIDILSRHPAVEEAILFGSRAKGNAKPSSDIDLALRGPRLSLDDILSLSQDFDQCNDLPWKVDIVLWEQIITPALKEHIERVGISIYQKTEKA